MKFSELTQNLFGGAAVIAALALLVWACALLRPALARVPTIRAFLYAAALIGAVVWAVNAERQLADTRAEALRLMREATYYKSNPPFDPDAYLRLIERRR